MATERNPAVLAMVEAELREDREATNDYLFSRAVNIDSSIAELTPPQFHARYPLAVKRKFAREEGRHAKPRRRNREELPVASREPEKKQRISPFLEDREPRRENGDVPGSSRLTGREAAAELDHNAGNRIRRPGGMRRRMAQARVQGPILEFDDAALRTTLLRLMRDVADAAGKGPGRVVEVVAKVDSYADDVKETARIGNVLVHR